MVDSDENDLHTSSGNAKLKRKKVCHLNPPKKRKSLASPSTTPFKDITNTTFTPQPLRSSNISNYHGTSASNTTHHVNRLSPASNISKTPYVSLTPPLARPSGS
jgi:hypothetical protein